MDFVAFPLRVERGRLARSRGAEESLLWLLSVMARTARRGWPGAPDFGLAEALEEMRRNQDARSAAVRQINRVLEDLGVDWVRVEDLRWVGLTQPGLDSYVLTLSDPGNEKETRVVAWNPESRPGAS